jgi:hypothetical protein
MAVIDRFGRRPMILTATVAIILLNTAIAVMMYVDRPNQVRISNNNF